MASVVDSDQPFGQCRCCLNFGYHKDIAEPYHNNGIREVYQDMFLECFNLLLSKNAELTRLICKSCIRRLQDASEFKSMVVESERQLLSDLGINNIEFVNLIENDKCDVGDKSKDDVTNIDVNGTKGHYDNGTIEIDDESIQNDDETIQNDYETLDDEPVENYYDDAGINETQEEDDNFVLLIVGDEKVGTEKPVKHKMSASSPCQCSDCNPTDHSYARARRGTKNIYSNSLRSRKAVNNSPDDDPIKLEAKNLTSENEEKDPDWHVSDEDTGQKIYRKSKKVHIREGDLKQYTKDDICIESLLRYTCPICQYVTNNSVHFQNHLEAHTAADTYVCDICCYIARTKTLLSHHLRKHSGVKPFACNICKKRFLRSHSLKLHMRSHTGEKPYACKYCDKTFRDNSSLYTHNRIHTDERTFTCKICNKKLKNSQTLKHHIRTHYSRRLAACEICNKRMLPDTLRLHMMAHSGIKPFACDLCDYKTNTRTGLKEHRNTHIKPYVCNVCGRGFARNERLRDHYTMHTGERPFACTRCKNRRFATSRKLQAHMRTLHKRKRDVIVKD